MTLSDEQIDGFQDRDRHDHGGWTSAPLDRDEVASLCTQAHEANRLRAALAEAIELADEGWAYAGDYFTEKWGAPGRIAALRKLLDGAE